MTAESVQEGGGAHAKHRTATSYQRELSLLRKTLAREETLLRQKDALSLQQEVLRKESDHRLLNGMQMIVSLLSLQSQSSANSDVASHLAEAAKRVTMIESVHRHLHRFDGELTIAFKPYLEDLCCDYSTIISWDQHSIDPSPSRGWESIYPPRLPFRSALSSTN